MGLGVHTNGCGEQGDTLGGGGGAEQLKTFMMEVGSIKLWTYPAAGPLPELSAENKPGATALMVTDAFWGVSPGAVTVNEPAPVAALAGTSALSWVGHE
jgi:hypothetical protein